MNSIGYVAEGKVVKEEDGWYIITDDHVAVKLDVLWLKLEGVRVRLLLANLDTLDTIADMGCQPGQEADFITSLTEDQIKDL